MTFNEAGQVTLFNVGYVIDRTVGNTGGLGGACGAVSGIKWRSAWLSLGRRIGSL